MITKKIIIEGSFPESTDENQQPKFRMFTEPELDELKHEDVAAYLSLATSGFTNFLIKVLSCYDTLRVPTQVEYDNHFYFFENEESLKNYKSRRNLYTEISAVLNNVLRVSFPDVEFITHCDEKTQKMVFEKSAQRIDTYNKKLKKLVEQVKKELEEQASNNGDDVGVVEDTKLDTEVTKDENQ